MKRHRNGISLVELLFTMSMGSALMFLGIGVLHQVFQFSSASRRLADNDRSATRLAQAFRADVHGATEILLEGPDNVRIFGPDDWQVVYTARDHQVERVENSPLGENRHESYFFDESLTASFGALTKPNRGVLTVHRRTPLNEELRPDRYVEAVVNRRQALEAVDSLVKP